MLNFIVSVAPTARVKFFLSACKSKPFLLNPKKAFVISAFPVLVILIVAFWVFVSVCMLEMLSDGESVIGTEKEIVSFKPTPLGSAVIVNAILFDWNEGKESVAVNILI